MSEVSTVSTRGTAPAAEVPTPVMANSRIGPWMAGIWLVFLAQPLGEAVDRLPTVRGVLGVLSTLAFATVYMSLWWRMRRMRVRLQLHPGRAAGFLGLGALVVLGAAMVLTVGQEGTAASVYIAAAAVMLFPTRLAIVVVLVDAVVNLVLASEIPGWTDAGWLTFSILASSLAVWGVLSMMRRNIDLIRAHEANAALAVDNERGRFARDLHDILGHSLTVITVKAELAQRLLDVDVDRARTELADLERLSRDALADVRRAVEGYRELTLPGELARARTALAAAEIEADLPHSTDDVPTELRDLFAWTVREGVTNVIRHSGARHCAVRLGPDSAEVCDDGRGPDADARPGTGLHGLRERAGQVGAVVVTRALDPGYSLRVSRS